mgnify:CR=1 FL=1
MSDRLHGLLPVSRGDSLGVVVDGPEVECRAVAGEVTGIRRRVRAFALRDRQADQEGVEGEGGVDVEVAEENLLRSGYSDLLSGGALCDRATRYHRRRSARLRHLAGLLVASEPPATGAQHHQPDYDQETHQNDDH